MDIWVQVAYNSKYRSVTGPLSSDFTQADVQDNQMYSAITYPLEQGVRYLPADCGYDDYKRRNLKITRGFEPVCPASEIYSHTSSDRLQLIEFYES